MILSIWVWVNAVLATLYVGPVVIVAALLGIRDRRVYDWAPRYWSKWILFSSGAPVRLEGMDRISREHPQIFVSNHVSWFDVWVLATYLPMDYRFVAKKELERVPVFGAAWKAAGHISIDRSDRKSAIRSLERAGETIRRENASVVIFPEGTRSHDGTLQAFKKGAFMLALHTGVPIVPVAVIGSERVLAKGSWRVRRLPIIVRFGEPIETRGFTEEDRDELVQLTYDRVRALLEAPVPAESRDGS